MRPPEAVRRPSVWASRRRPDDFGKADLVIVMGQVRTNHHGCSTLSRHRSRWRHGRGRPLPGVADAYRIRSGSGLVGKGTKLADGSSRSGSAATAPVRRWPKRVCAEGGTGTVLDHDSSTPCGVPGVSGAHPRNGRPGALDATGLTAEQVDSLADRYIKSDATIITWCLRSQHKPYQPRSPRS